MSLVGGPGIFRAMKDENMIMGIDGDAGNLAEDHAVRNNGPAVHHRVGISGILLGRRRASEKCGQEKRKHQVSTKNQHDAPLRLQTSRTTSPCVVRNGLDYRREEAAKVERRRCARSESGKAVGRIRATEKNVLACGDTRGRWGAIRGESVGREPFT